MAFSGFGTKPATPTTTSLFGAPKPATTSIFGSQPAQQQSTFGATTSQPSTNSPFGGAGATTGQPQQTNLFGQPAQQQQPSTSLFGQQNPQQQQPSTSLFGQPNQQQQQQSTSLFGQPNQQQQQPSTGLFGQQNQQQQPQQQTSVFGGGSSLFGVNNNNQPAAASTFGATQQQPSANLGSSILGGVSNTLFGQKPAQQQSITSQPIFAKTTKFNDLPEELKKTFENIESHIQGRIQISKELSQLKVGEEALKGQDLIRSLHQDFVSTSSVVHSDLRSTRDLKSKVDQSVQDIIIATRVIDASRQPQQQAQQTLKNHVNFPQDYFSRISEQMYYRLQWFKATIEQIERKLSSTMNQTQQTPQAISAALQAQHATFIALASKTFALDAELQKIKTVYTQLWRAKTGSMRDPFNELDRGAGNEFGLDALKGR